MPEFGTISRDLEGISRMAKGKSVVIKNEDAPWERLEDVGSGKTFAPHPRSVTKILVGNKSKICPSDKFDFLISIFDPGGSVEIHSHENTGTEHVFYILKGKGTVMLDGEKHIVEAGTTIWIPSDAKHSLLNNGDEPILMAVVSVPPENLG